MSDSTSWESFVGQDKLKKRLKIHVQSSLDRMARLEHILLLGKPGFGKTTLARIIADEAELPFREHIMPIKKRQLYGLVAGYQGLVLFDELHRMSKAEQEGLLGFMVTDRIETDYGAIIENNGLTIVGATTEPGKIIEPLFDRFPVRPSFADYTDKEMALIVQRAGREGDIDFPLDMAMQLGRAAGGVPRIAVQIANMGRDLNTTSAKKILAALDITPDGLTVEHRQYLEILTNQGMCGIDSISAQLGLPKNIVAGLEKLLVKRGYVQYDRTGRVATTKAYSQRTTSIQPSKPSCDASQRKKNT